MQNFYSRNLHLIIALFSLIALCTSCRTWAEREIMLSLTDDVSGCTVESPLPPVYTSVRFTGECSNHRANGYGKAVFYTAENKPAMEYEGMFVDGKLQGKGKAFVHNGSYIIEGQWQDGCPVGCTASAYPPILFENPTRGMAQEQLQVEKNAVIAIEQIQPYIIYPGDARLYGRVGRVTLQVLVSIDGQIVRAYVGPEGTDPGFAFSALNAIFQSGVTAEPAIMNGVPVPTWVVIPITYKMR